MSTAPDSPIPSEPSRFAIRRPRSPWLGIMAGVLIVGGVSLRIGIPLYRQEIAIREIERFQGSVKTRQRGPNWLRALVGDKDMELFEDIIAVNLSLRPATDVTMEYVGHLSSLEVLSLSRTQVTDAGLAHLKGLTRLKTLVLSDTQVTDAGLKHLEDISSLEFLYLENTRVSDAALENFARLTSLKELLLKGTDVADDGLA